MALDNKDLWAIYAKSIAQAAGLPGSPDNFILTGSSLIANLANGSSHVPSHPSKEEALFQVYNLANTQVHQNGIYDATEALFFNDYATYIDNLTPKSSSAPTPAQQTQINNLRTQLGMAQPQYQNDLNSALNAWEQQGKMFPGKYPTFQSFVNTSNWGATLNNDQSNLDGINSKLSTIMTTVYGQDYVAITTNKTAVDQVRKDMLGVSVNAPTEMEVKATSGKLIVPTYNPGSLPTFSTWVDNAISNHGKGKPAVSVNFTTSSAQYDFSQSTYFVHTDFKVNFFFFSLKGSANVSRIQTNVDTSSSEFSLTMEFDAITQVDLVRGPWYDSSLMDDYQNPHNLAVPTKLFVAMYPKITLKMDAQSYTSARTDYTSSGGFGVGIFWANANASGGKTNANMKSTWDANSNSVTIEDDTGFPIIVGMEATQVDDVN